MYYTTANQLDNGIYRLRFCWGLRSSIYHPITQRFKYKQRYRRRSLPKHIVNLRSKRKTWKVAKRTGNLSSFLAARKTAKAALRVYQRNLEQRIIYNEDKRAFFSYINHKINSHKTLISLYVKDRFMSERESAQIFRQKFAKNFSIAFDTALPVLSQSSASAPQLVFNCTETAVMEALTSCPNS